tara:strand:+ start:195 stop:521 length:327 start_codon:yes stop_codon:yes gene_type:complete
VIKKLKIITIADAPIMSFDKTFAIFLLEYPPLLIITISFDAFSLLNVTIIPKKRLIGISREEYWIIFNARSCMRNIDGTLPSLTSSINLKLVLASNINKIITKIENTA